MATDTIYTNNEEEQVCFDIEVRVPFSQARAFAKAMTGHDDDVILAAETAIRERIGRGAYPEVELTFYGDVTAALLEAAQVADVPQVGHVRVAIFGPNLHDESKGSFHVHAADCTDRANYGPAGRYGGEYGAWVLDAASKRDVVEHVYDAQLAEGSDYESCSDDIWFAPCLQLPEEAP